MGGFKITSDGYTSAYIITKIKTNNLSQCERKKSGSRGGSQKILVLK